MIMSYKKVKAVALGLYDAFLPLVMEIKGSSATTFDTTLEKLSKDAESIRNDVFRLMIVGEAKSGKSTFINAYLGREILPMDVKQCTSAIVEIRYGAKYKLFATYADDRVTVLEDEAEINQFLKGNAALDDEYRDIPVGIINLQLIIPSKGKRIPEADIKSLLRIIEKENIYKLDPPAYERKVRKYIADKLPHWREIVQKIEIEYPFEDEDLKGVQIVDSPGVNAEGRVGEITNDYIINANAVMFLKPLVGAPLETTSFKKFLETASADRNPDAIFLVLTRAANELSENVTRIQEEAYRQFPSINKKQIIRLDSKVELFRNKVKRMSEEDLRAFMDAQIEENKLDAFLETPWYRSRFNREDYLQKLGGLSNFSEMDIALNQFARKAHYLLLSQLLGRMVLVLEKIASELSESAENYKAKAENPAELSCKLLNAEEALRDLQKKINVTLSDITRKYKDTGGIIETRVREEMAAYRAEISESEINPDDPHSVEELEKVTFRKINKLTEFEARIQTEIVAVCDEALIAFSKKDELNYTSLKPDLTPETIQKIKAERRSQAEEEYKKGVCFKQTHTRLDQSKFFGLVRGDIERRIDKISDDLVIALHEHVTKVTGAYRTELVRNAGLQEERYRKIREDKATADEMQAKIADMEAKISRIKPVIDELRSLKGGIDKNV